MLARNGVERDQRFEAEMLPHLRSLFGAAYRMTGNAHDAEDLERALAALPESFRTAVMLRDLQELSYAEIAAALGVPVRLDDRRAFKARGDSVRLLRVEGELVGIVAEREADVEAFETSLRPLVAAWASR